MRGRACVRQETWDGAAFGGMPVARLMGPGSWVAVWERKLR